MARCLNPLIFWNNLGPKKLLTESLVFEFSANQDFTFKDESTELLKKVKRSLGYLLTGEKERPTKDENINVLTNNEFEEQISSK